ncbi:hypothetical protein [Luteolibacter sp. AS25]|uniref:hypothetical protein n=1 Tax=Luteolibacter sp. AS25 TaxID=3135776 RepID=UPI00398B73EB
MKPQLAILASSLALALSSCEKEQEKPKPESAAIPEPKSKTAEELIEADTPLLPIKKGDYWKYSVSVEIPAGVTSDGASAVEIDQVKTRTYLGKVKVDEKLPEVDAFDVVSPGEPVMRELVEITDTAVMMRGSILPEVLDSKPLWLDPPVPFAYAGMRAGQGVAPLSIQEGARKRGMKIVGREKVEVPAGEYMAVRMLMTGNDGDFEVRRTTWFVPQVGIVKEEKSRYRDEKLLFRELTVLSETNVKKD